MRRNNLVGTVNCEPVVKAETDLLNAQLDVAENAEKRVVLLTDAVTRERKTLKWVEGIDFVNTDADELWWRSISLHTHVRLLKTKKEGVSQIKALQKKRIEALTKLAEFRESQYAVGTTWPEAVVSAHVALLNAQMDAAEKHEERVAIWEQAVTMGTRFLNTAEARLKAGTVTQADVYRARALVLTVKIGLLEEASPNGDVAAQTKTAHKERAEALAQLAKLLQEEYRKARTDLTAVLSAETDLVNAQVSATDKREVRIAALEEGVKRETDFLKTVEARYNAGTVSEADVCETRSCLLDVKSRLLRERGLQKVRNK